LVLRAEICQLCQVLKAQKNSRGKPNDFEYLT
jgi:hypothetical protein